MKSLFLRLRSSLQARPASGRGPDALEAAALQRLLPLAMGNAPHPYQASLLLYVMQQQQQQR